VKACRYGEPVSARSPAETGSPDSRPWPQKQVRFELSPGRDRAQKRVRFRFSVARRIGYAPHCHSAPLICRNLYPFLRTRGAEMGTPTDAQATCHPALAETGTVSGWVGGRALRCQREAACRASAYARRFGHHAHPARRPGSWLAVAFPSFDSHEQVFGPCSLGAPESC
jgi:hypothetical protein